MVLGSLSLVPRGLSQGAQPWTTNELPAGCIAWWQAGGNELDTVGVHNGAAESGPNFYAPDYAAGKRGLAWLFNGVNQSVSIPNVHSDLDGWTQFTLEAWVKFSGFPATPGNGYGAFSKVGNNRGPYSGNYGYQFAFTTGASNLVLQFNQDGQLWPGFMTTANLNGTVTSNAWYHVAATYDANAVTLYLNGLPLTNNVIGPVSIASTTASLRLSMDDNFNVPFPGMIDDARIYNRALSETEIAFLHAGPPPLLAISRASAATNILSWATPDGQWLLQQSPAINAPPSSWSTILPPYPTNATQVLIGLGTASNHMFYRLHWSGN
jgi:hypothetical protein